MEPTDRKSNWFKSLTRRKKSSNKENNQNVNIDTSVLAIPSESTESAFNRQTATNSNSSQSQSSTKSSNVLSWVTMFRKRALQRRRDVNADLISASENRLMNFERRAVANDYVFGLPNLDIPPDQMYIYSHILTPQQQHNFVMSRVNAMTNQIESPWLIQETSPNMEHLIMLNAQVLMNK